MRSWGSHVVKIRNIFKKQKSLKKAENQKGRKPSTCTKKHYLHSYIIISNKSIFLLNNKVLQNFVKIYLKPNK